MGIWRCVNVTPTKRPCGFDRLYNDWPTLDKFQRTRGVLSSPPARYRRLHLEGFAMPSDETACCAERGEWFCSRRFPDLARSSPDSAAR